MSGIDIHGVQQSRKLVDQLRRERNVRRTPISACATDLIRLVLHIMTFTSYCRIINYLKYYLFRFTQQNQADDYLINSHANDKTNPYRPKNSIQCSLI